MDNGRFHYFFVFAMVCCELFINLSVSDMTFVFVVVCCGQFCHFSIVDMTYLYRVLSYG